MSYNQGAYNQLSYNQSGDPYIYAAVSREIIPYQDRSYNQLVYNRPSEEILISEGCGIQLGASARATGTFTAKATAEIKVNGEAMASATRFGSAEANIQLGAVLNAGKLLIVTAEALIKLTVSIDNESFRIYTMEYDGILQPGERIIINTENFTAKVNNEDALPMFEGQWVNLKTGINEIVVESDTSVRTLLIRVEHRDRSV